MIGYAKGVALLVFILAAAWSVAAPAAAQDQDRRWVEIPCSTMPKMIEMLSRFGEVPLMQLRDATGVLTVFVRPAEPGSWTVTVTDANGEVCPATTGYDWSFIRPAPGEPS